MDSGVRRSVFALTSSCPPVVSAVDVWRRRGLLCKDHVWKTCPPWLVKELLAPRLLMSNTLTQDSVKRLIQGLHGERVFCWIKGVGFKTELFLIIWTRTLFDTQLLFSPVLRSSGQRGHLDSNHRPPPAEGYKPVLRLALICVEITDYRLLFHEKQLRAVRNASPKVIIFYV